jgi:hypothetical protein
MWRRWRKWLGSDVGRRWLWLFFLMAVLGLYKITFTGLMTGPHTDGGYYTDIASHVRDGRGLVTNICLVHKGCPSFPHPTAIYPLWPLVYGYVARFFPLFETGIWLATLGYFLTLLFGYAWGTALHKESLFPRAAPGFGAGHLFVVMLGLSGKFFEFTSLPYTEGLCFAIVLAALWRFVKLWPAPSWHAGLEMGVWLSLAALARSQMVLMAVAAAPVLVGAAVFLSKPERKRYAVMAAFCVLGIVLVMTPRYLQLRAFVPDLRLAEVLRWDQIRYDDSLSVLNIMQPSDSPISYLSDRLDGVWKAFDTRGGHAYAKQFYAFQYAPLVAAVLLCSLGFRRRVWRHWKDAWRWWQRPQRLNIIFVTLFALGSFVSLHTMHLNTDAGPEWLFGGRWAIVCIFAFFLSMLLLLRANHGWRAVAVFLLCSSTFVGFSHIRNATKKIEARTAVPPRHHVLVGWLNRRHAKRGHFVAITKTPQHLAHLTPGVGYHWHHAHTSVADLGVMVTKLGAELLIVPRKGKYAFRQDPAFAAAFTPIAKPAGYIVYAPSKRLLAKPKR